MKLKDLEGRLRDGYRVIPLDRLRPAPWNYKADDVERARQLAASIDSEKEALVLLVRRLPGENGTYEVIDGNHRLEALRQLGWEGAICRDYGTISDPRAVKIAVAVNETRFDSDVAKLADLFADVLLPAYGMETLTAELPYSPDELAIYAAGGPLIDFGDVEELDDPGPQIDKAEELREKWSVERGQLWQLGEHRVICGDCTCTEVGKVDVLMTDPPYGIRYNAGSLDKLAQKHGLSMSSTSLLVGDDEGIDLSWLWNYKRRMVWGFPYVWDPHATGWIVWDKQPGMDRRGIVAPVEIASTTMRKGFDIIRFMWMGYYRAGADSRFPHPTQKPVGVVMPFVDEFTKPAEIVYDPFLGSGTTLIACEKLGRKCRGIEIEPKYVAVTIQRWVDVTGKEPALLERKKTNLKIEPTS